MSKVAVVVGIGPGIGAAVSKRFGKEGLTVALMSRSLDKMKPVAEAIRSAGGKALEIDGVDATDPASVKTGFEKIKEQAGADYKLEVVVCNSGSFVRGNVVDLDPQAFADAWKGNCFGAFNVAQNAIPPMMEAKRGCLIFTGATAGLRGSAGFAGLATGKFGLRALTQSLARELQKEHQIHVAHVIIDGMVDLEKTRNMVGDVPEEFFMKPDSIADTYWHLYQQDKSAWTSELELRPFCEKF